MAKIGYGIKWGRWIAPLGVLLPLLALTTAQPGFLSIHCGAKTNETDENNITWVSDANYIDVGQTGEIGHAYAYGLYLRTLRVFPKPLNKSCYQLPVVPNVPYLLRLWFAVGNYSGFKQFPLSFAFSIETLGMLAMGNVTVPDKDAFYNNETILVSSGRVLYICFIRTSEHHDPFISAIELRTLQQGMYGQAKPGTILMSVWRYDVGGDSIVRYPEDKFDRIWDYQSRLTIDNHNSVGFLNSEEPISTNNTEELPPTVVMQTAEVILDERFHFQIGTTDGHKLLLLLYFAEIQKLNMSQWRSFYVKINDEIRSEAITSLSNYSTRELTFISNQTDDFKFAFLKTADATSYPIINAFETYKVVDTQPATYAQDLKALEAIKSRFDIKDWISDPCFSIQWKGIVCESSTSPIRISEIYLSGNNLTGLVPNDIGQLTALVKVSLDNNYLMGPLPNFSSLTMLERLYLQNNNLSCTIPYWLGELKNLKELNIDNNNFSGVIPAQLINGLMKFRHSSIINLAKISWGTEFRSYNGIVPLWNSAPRVMLHFKPTQMLGKSSRVPDRPELCRIYFAESSRVPVDPELRSIRNSARFTSPKLAGKGENRWVVNLLHNNQSSSDSNQSILLDDVQSILLDDVHRRSVSLVCCSYCGNPYLSMHKGKCILHNTKKNKWKIFLGITLSGILIIALALIVALVVYRNRFRRTEQGAANKRSGLEMEPRPYLYQDYSMVMVPNSTKSRAFTLDEMIAATQTFSQEIGRGGFGSVFLGKLPQQKYIAVKVLSQSSQQGVNEFLNEVDLLSRIHHRNLVSLLGYCNESREVMLIYEYMPGGSLRDHLYGRSAHHSNLSWRTRLKVALAAAQGLEYLHVGCNPKIIHRDIKTANILLDSDFNGKLADFGLSKMTMDGEATHVTTAIKGTAGYLDPEYYNTQMLTHKSDVYSFGVVLLEIICGRQPIDLKLPAEELNLIRWVRPYIMDVDSPGKIAEIIDKRLVGGYDMISITGVAKVAMRCVEAEPSSRPSVSEVVAELKEAVKQQDRGSPISMPEEIGIESSEILAGPAHLSVDLSGRTRGMEWSDNSSDISQLGR